MFFKKASPLTEDSILKALGRITLPDKGGDIVTRGMVEGLTVSNGRVSFAIAVDPKQGAALEPLRVAAEKVVRGMAGVQSVTAVLTAHRSAPPAQEKKPLGKIDMPNVKHIIAVASGKGGVGKSTTAVNLAVAMALNGLKVGLLDADIYGPSIPRMMHVTGKPETTDGKKMIPFERYGVKMMSMGFLIAEDAPMIWRGPMVHSAIQQLFRDVLWGDLDIIVADMPPGTGDAQLTMAQQVPLSGVVIVSTPQDIALLDARKGLNMFRRVDVPVLGLIENMSTFQCPHCGEHTHIFNHGGARDEAVKLGVPFLGELPLDIKVRETSDSGEPITATQPTSPIAHVYRTMATKIWESLISHQEQGAA